MAMASDPIPVAIAVPAETDSATVGARPFAPAQGKHAVPLQGVAAMAAPVASPLPQRKPWELPSRGLAVFHGRPETPRLFHYFLPRLLAEGKQVLCLDGANRFDPLLIARLARQRGIAPAEFNRSIRVARAFTCFQLTELLVRVPRLLEKFAANALVVTALPDLYFDEDVRERDACVTFRHALDALQALAPLPLGVAVFSDATSFESPRRAGCGLHLEPAGKKTGLYLEPARKNMFTQLAAQATELWRFAVDEENGKLRLIGEKSCSPPLKRRATAVSMFCGRGHGYGLPLEPARTMTRVLGSCGFLCALRVLCVESLFLQAKKHLTQRARRRGR